MALDPVVNFFRSTIATLPVASGGTSIVITTGDGAKLPDPAVDGAFNLTIYNEDDPFDAPEIVRVTAIAGDTLTVTRAQEGTSATNKTSGNTWYLELTPTAKTIQDIDTAKLDVADVVNNLTSTDTDKPLSANQGKVLQDSKEPADATILKQANIVNNLTSTSTTAPLSANQGKVLQDGKEPADATILKQANIVDNLTSTSTTAPLSANQGKVLQDGKLNLSGGTMTGDLTIPDKIIHSGDTNTAIRFPSADVVAIETAGVERMRVDSSGNVGIKTANPATLLEIAEPSNTTLRISSTKNDSTHSTTVPFGSVEFYSFDASGAGAFGGVGVRAAIRVFPTAVSGSGSDMVFTNAPDVERMRITGVGNVGIGTNAPAKKLHVSNSYSAPTGGHDANTFAIVSNSGAAGNYAGLELSGGNDGGSFIHFGDTDNADVGAIVYFHDDNLMRFDVNAAERMRITSAGVVQPGADNTQTLGSASFRWSEVFAGNATINTSDVTEKQDIAELNEAEQQVATALKGLIRKYRWISSVEQKGEDARIHVGVMAQDVAQAFEDAGLDAHRYGVFCEDTWYTKEETYTEQVENPDFDEEAEEGEDNLRMIDGDEQTRTVSCEADDLDATEHVRFGVRYDQLWAFIISAL